MTNKEIAKLNYGRTWTDEMLAALVAKKKLSAADYKEITGNEYVTPSES